jgi:sterol desaturase/sphingolipid hydroxylase (fatty acid hydroxylase superfamily)
MATLMQSLSVPEILLLQWVVSAARYALFAGGAWLVFWRWLYPKGRSRRLSPRTPDAAQIRREIRLSALSMTLFLIPIGVGVIGTRLGFSKVYFRAEEQGWAWYFGSYAALIAWHETYFYWTHRLLHWGPVFRRVHRAHHLSRHPTPFTAFAFHPFEALVEGFAIVPFIFLVPIQLGVVAVFAAFSLAFNVYGHLGMRGFNHDRGLARLVNSPETHGAHHARFNGNYSLYTTVWDRIMGTELRPLDRSEP